MIYIESKEFDPRFNLALEQYVFDEMDCSETYFMLWQNSPSIIIGRNQNAAAEIDSEYVRSRGIPVVRRLSGGGAVYHDLGNLNFTFITDRDEAGGIDSRPFCEPVVKAVGSFGAEAVISGRNDILAEGCKMYPQVLKNVVVDDKDGTLADQQVMDAVNACTEALGETGRVLLRKSGTEPVLRVMSEAGTKEDCEKYVDRIISAMQESGHLIEVK